AGTNGPTAVPGEYQARLTVDDRPPEVQTFQIGISPLLGDVTEADLDAKFDLAMKVRDRTSEANQAVIDIRDIKSQVEERTTKDASIKQPADSLDAKFTGVEGEIYQYRNQSNQDPLNFPIRLNNKIAALMGAVEGVNGRPTAQAYEVYDLLSGELEAQLERLDTLIDTDLADFNRLLQQKGLEPVRIPATRKKTVTD
ncbi:MAG: glycosyl hydrolase, partial [Gemmatimonadota bacterium]